MDKDEAVLDGGVEAVLDGGVEAVLVGGGGPSSPSPPPPSFGARGDCKWKGGIGGVPNDVYLETESNSYSCEETQKRLT